MFRFFLLLLVALTLYANEREKAICGFIKEPLAFWLWSSKAPKPDPARVAHIPFLSQNIFLTSDNKRLYGYIYYANDTTQIVPPKGSLLVFMGNAMSADAIVGFFKNYTLKGYDVYIYDYRGYGNSEGKRRLHAILEDAKEIAASLAQRYERKLILGISLGGFVAVNVAASGAAYDKIALDSAPSFLSPYGCPASIDPIEVLPRDASKFLVMTGGRDEVLGANILAPLQYLVKERGGATYHGCDFAHAFADRDITTHMRRLQALEDFLTAP